MFTLPDKGEGQNDIQSRLFQEYIDVLIAGINGIDCVLSGLAVTAQGSPNQTVAVAKGSVLSNGGLFAVAANASVTVTAADGTNPRIDLVVITSAGAIAVRAGTAAASPKPPARTANDVVIAALFIPTSDTTIDATAITDMRVMRGGAASGGGAPITLKKVTTPVSFNTNATIQTYLTLTIPDGLGLPGQIFHVECGGSMLLNSGTPTVTLTIDLDGTAMVADVTSVATADTDRLAWHLSFDLICQASADEAINGVLVMSPVGAKTAPTTGVGLDMLTPAALTNVAIVSPFNGSSVANMNTGNRDLRVRWTMNVSNAADEIVMEYAFAELV